MHARDVVHVAARGRKAFGRGLLSSSRATGVHRRSLRDTGRCRDARRTAPTARAPAAAVTCASRERPREHLIDLAHRHARIGTHRQQRGARLRRRFGPRDAEEMPRRVLHIVGIHRAVRLELAAAVVVAAGVVERDATLPELRRGLTARRTTAIEPATESSMRPAMKSATAAVEERARVARRWPRRATSRAAAPANRIAAHREPCRQLAADRDRPACSRCGHTRTRRRSRVGAHRRRAGPARARSA